MLSIGPCILGDIPRVAVALRDGVHRGEVESAMERGGDIIEMRIDNFGSHEAAHVCAELEAVSDLPVIGTIRRREEGGGWHTNETQRLKLYQTIMPLIDAVDIELNADAVNREVITCAREQGVPVIGSFHDFQRTPEMSSLKKTLDKGDTLGVDIVKVAAHCADMTDLRRLAQLLLEHQDRAMVVIGMGRHGTVSRALFPALGSLLTYTFIGKPSAPGQMDLDNTVATLRRYFDV